MIRSRRRRYAALANAVASSVDIGLDDEFDAYWVPSNRDPVGGALIGAGSLGTGVNIFMQGGSADPEIMPYGDGPHFKLPGTSSNNLSVPNAPATTVTGSFDLMGRNRLQWQSVSSENLASQYASGSRQIAAHVVSGGLLNIIISEDGTATAQTNSAQVPFANGEDGWWRIEFRASDGRIRFFTAPGDLTDPTGNWTQLGSDGASTARSVYAGTSDFVIGAYTVSGGSLAGRVYRLMYYDGLSGSGGTKVLDVAATDADEDSDTFVCDTGQTVTIHRTTSGIPTTLIKNADKYVYDGIDDYTQALNNAVFNIAADEDFTIIGLIRQHGNRIGNGRYFDKRGWSSNGYSIFSPNTAGVALTGFLESGGSSGQMNNTSLIYGKGSFIALRIDRSVDQATIIRDGIAATTSIAGYGAFTDTTPFTVGAYDPTGGFQRFEFMGLGIVRGAVSDADIVTKAAALEAYNIEQSA